MCTTGEISVLKTEYCEVDVSIILFVCHVAPPFVIGVHHTPPLIMRYLYCEVDK